ncbi:TauD/TfdA family dioxygenase [Actinokineospora diospyrosa]|uniref:TauD/TfdA family dioxygenase n=1 Tax=Actinokineospora diospyrosa TaxID=103728 RepID=UPI0020A53A6D|nr:TauD/TfdA family dioxygenase [Actinokineospora diospyrosa]
MIDDRDLETCTPDEFVDLALAATPLLPADLRRGVIEYRRYAPEGDVILVRGLLPDSAEFPETAKAPYAPPPPGQAQRASLLLASVTTMLGEPFNYASLYHGRVVQNMVPVRKMEFTQTSQSSTGMLDWHCEDSFRDDRCDYAGLLCLRGDPTAASKYSQARDVDLAPAHIAVLRQPRYHVRPDPAHVLAGEVSMRRLPILSGSASSPEIAYDTHHLEPLDEADTEAAEALRELGAALDEAAISHVMARGDLLIFDNKRVVHARTPFTARYDGTDRWLMRTMICGSALTFRRWGTRIPD